jgi:hypothetical protein
LPIHHIGEIKEINLHLPEIPYDEASLDERRGHAPDKSGRIRIV